MKWDRPGYIAHILLANHATFLQYKIETWPFLHVNSNVTLQIELPSQVAYDTTQGLMFIPHECVGRHPQICHTGPIYRKNHLSCIRGVLTNDVTLRNTCKVTIHRDDTLTESIIEVQPNTFLMVSAGEELKLLCDGQPQRTVKLPAGSSTVHVSPKYTLTNDRWLVIRSQYHPYYAISPGNCVQCVKFNLQNTDPCLFKSPQMTCIPVH